MIEQITDSPPCCGKRRKILVNQTQLRSIDGRPIGEPCEGFRRTNHPTRKFRWCFATRTDAGKMRDGDGVKLIVDSFNPLPQAVDFDFHPANGAMSVLG